MQTFAIANQKGGVGKTATTYHLSRALISHGLSVMVIDMDPQGNATSVLTVQPPASDDIGVADALYETLYPKAEGEPLSLTDVAVTGLWEGLSVVPTVGDQLASVRDHFTVAGTGREWKLKELLGQVPGVDVVLIDCPPSLDLLTINALTAADAVLVVAKPDLLSLNGMSNLLKTIANVRSYNNPGLRVAGVLINEAQETQLSARFWRRELLAIAQHQDWDVLDPVIPRRVAIKHAIENGVGLDELTGKDNAVELAGLYARHARNLMGAAQ